MTLLRVASVQALDLVLVRRCREDAVGGVEFGLDPRGDLVTRPSLVRNVATDVREHEEVAREDDRKRLEAVVCRRGDT